MLCSSAHHAPVLVATKRETEVATRDEDALPYSPTVYRIKSGEEVAKREAEELAARDDDAVTYNPAVYVVD